MHVAERDLGRDLAQVPLAPLLHHLLQQPFHAVPLARHGVRLQRHAPVHRCILPPQQGIFTHADNALRKEKNGVDVVPLVPPSVYLFKASSQDLHQGCSCGRHRDLMLSIVMLFSFNGLSASSPTFSKPNDRILIVLHIYNLYGITIKTIGCPVEFYTMFVGGTAVAMEYCRNVIGFCRIVAMGRIMIMRVI